MFIIYKWAGPIRIKNESLNVLNIPSGKYKWKRANVDYKLFGMKWNIVIKLLDYRIKKKEEV